MDRFEYQGDEEAPITVEVPDLPVEVCDQCGEQYVGPTAASAQHRAVCRALGLLTPEEILSIRTRFGPNQAAFAALTGIGVATISRWERGRLLQNRAMDRYLRLFRANPGIYELLKSLTTAPSSNLSLAASADAPYCDSASTDSQRHLGEAVGTMIIAGVPNDPLQKFRDLKQQFFERTRVPGKNQWKGFDDDKIWITMVMEVMAVGGARAVDERFKKNPGLQARISYSSLKVLPSETQRRQAIHRVLREAKIRRAARILAKCRKTEALAHNFEVVKGVGGPKAFVEAIARIDGDQQKILYVQENLKYFGSKCARDALMELGLVEQALAFDSRVTTLLREVGVEIDERFESSEKVYAREERRLLSELCEPLGMKGVEFDRMLYQDYDAILASLNGTGKTPRKLKKERAQLDRFGMRVGSGAAEINKVISEKPKTAKEILDESGVETPLSRIYGHMRKLIERGFVVKTEDGKYAVKS
jgi:putative zinc finger/helix-turn-helix YgiT family protein